MLHVLGGIFVFIMIVNFFAMICEFFEGPDYEELQAIQARKDANSKKPWYLKEYC